MALLVLLLIEHPAFFSSKFMIEDDYILQKLS